MVNNNIYKTKFYQDRIELIQRDEYERTSGLRRPSTERYKADATVALLTRRNSLQNTLKVARSGVSQNLDYGDVSEDGTITAKPLDLELYKGQRQIILDSLNQINSIDQAITALDGMGCPFYGDLVAEIQKVQQQIRQVSTKIDKLKHSTVYEATETQSQIKGLSTELADLEKNLKNKMAIKTKMDNIIAEVNL